MNLIQLLSAVSLKWLIISYFVYVYILKRALRRVRLMLHYRSFPTISGHFLLGHIKQIWTNFPLSNKLEDIQINFCKFFDKPNAKDQPLLIGWVSIIPFLIVTSHELAEIIMKINLKRTITKRNIDLGDGLITSDPDIWKVRRKLIEPFFTTKKLKAQVETMNAEVESFCQKLDKMVGKPVDLEHQIQSSTLNIILNSTLSIPLDDSIEDKKEMLKLVAQMEPNFIKRLLNPFYFIDWIFKNTEFGRNWIETSQMCWQMFIKMRNRRKHLLSYQSNDTESADFFNLLEGKVDEKGMYDELKTFVAAGHETTAISLRWIFFNLGNHQEEQEKLYQEILQYFPDDTRCDLNAINQCNYLDWCIKESLRLNPPVMMTGRYLDEDIMFEGKRLLKGTRAVIQIKLIHRDPNIYPEPDKFDPDRWSPENAIKIPKTAFIPFGYGPRSCIGYRYALIELKIYTIHVIRKFILRSTRKHESIPSKYQFTSKPIFPMEIMLTSRIENR